MAKLFVRVALCAALLVCCGVAWAGGNESKSDPMVKTTPTEKGRESKIHVYLPTPESKLYFENTLMKGTGKDRTFKSPALEEGKRYEYQVVVVWVENGREVSHETKIVFKAGEDVAVDFRR
ncbi:MAG TPA: TIGR03000 domain-containing protein [Gemmataceae bacterium]|nr:TIGR03000 domain-containing protein [Gemmataceae bacterium]